MGARKEKVWSEDAAADAWEADTKNPNAIRLLGVAYERGRGRAANAKMARKMFLKSAMMGDVTAMRYVAGCYFRGVGGGVDYVEAFRWYSSPSGDSDGSRRRRGCHVDYSAETSRGRGRGREQSAETGRGDAAAEDADISLMHRGHAAAATRMYGRDRRARVEQFGDARGAS